MSVFFSPWAPKFVSAVFVGDVSNKEGNSLMYVLCTRLGRWLTRPGKLQRFCFVVSEYMSAFVLYKTSWKPFVLIPLCSDCC